MTTTPLSFTNGYVSLGGTDFSNLDQSVELPYAAKTEDSTTMGMDTDSNFPVSKTWSCTIKLLNSEASASVMQVLFPLVGSSTPQTLEVRPTNSGRAATNPGYNGKVCIESIEPIKGSWGKILWNNIKCKPFDLAGATGNTLLRSTS